MLNKSKFKNEYYSFMEERLLSVSFGQIVQKQSNKVTSHSFNF